MMSVNVETTVPIDRRKNPTTVSKLVSLEIPCVVTMVALRKGDEVVVYREPSAAKPKTAKRDLHLPLGAPSKKAKA